MTHVVSMRGDAQFFSGELRYYKYAKADVAASQTDSSIVSAVTGPNKRIVVVAAFWLCGSTATTLVFNSKGSGAGTAITGTYANDINGGMVLPYSPGGWFRTNSGEALTVTTGAGASTGITIVYIESV
jgi:hypothetical protein